MNYNAVMILLFLTLACGSQNIDSKDEAPDGSGVEFKNGEKEQKSTQSSQKKARRSSDSGVATLPESGRGELSILHEDFGRKNTGIVWNLEIKNLNFNFEFRISTNVLMQCLLKPLQVLLPQLTL